MERIQVAPDTNLIETRLKIENKIEPVDNIVAQLKSVGITGIMFIGLARKNPDDPDLSPVLDFTPPYTVIKTAPSEIKALLQGLDAVFSQIKALDVEGISHRLKTTIDILNQTAQTARIGELSSDISAVLQKIGKTAESVNAFVQDTKTTGRSIHALVLDSRKTVKQINGTFDSLDDMIRDNKNQLNNALVKLNQTLQETTALVQKGSGLVDNADTAVSNLEHHLLVTLYNIESAAENLNQLINVLANQPSQLDFRATTGSAYHRNIRPEKTIIRMQPRSPYEAPCKTVDPYLSCRHHFLRMSDNEKPGARHQLLYFRL